MSHKKPFNISLLSDLSEIDISHEDAHPHPLIYDIDNKKFSYVRDPDLSLTPEPGPNRQVSS